MTVIAFAARKGGVGKSTSAVLTALAVASRGDPVTLVDCDPQASASDWAALAGGLGEQVEIVAVARARLVADTVRRAVERGRTVIIDTPPGAGDWPLAEAAMAAADLAVVPMRPSIGDLAQLRITIDSADRVGTPSAVLLTQVRGRTRLASEVSQALDELEDVARLSIEIPMRAAIAEAYGTDAVMSVYEELADELAEITKETR